MEFIIKVKTFYEVVLEVTDRNEAKSIELFFLDLIFLLEAKVDTFEITVELLLLISLISNQQDSIFKQLIESSSLFLNILRNLIEKYSKVEKEQKTISQCIAQLPIEELQNLVS